MKLLSRIPTLSDPMDCSLPGSSIHGIFLARVLEWVAIDMTLMAESEEELKSLLVEAPLERERGEWKKLV